MDSVPDPPEGGNAALGAPATATEHFVALGDETEVDVELQPGNARTLAATASARSRNHMTNQPAWPSCTRLTSPGRSRSRCPRLL